MRVAHFIQRYPPALGGSEAYFARLSRYMADQGDQVTVFTTNAIDLEAFWSRQGRCTGATVETVDGVAVRRYPLWRWPGRRYMLKLANLVPQRLWQCLTLPCNPVSPALWRVARYFNSPIEAVHAGAFPYAWPIACARRLALRRRVPFLLTPFLHLGDPDDPRDPTRRAYTSPALRWLLKQADRVFVQTPGEQRAVRDLGVAAERIVLQGLGVEPSECAGGNRAKARKAWGIGADEVIVGHLANNSREKGTVDLLEAAQTLWKQNVALRVVLAGPEMANFRAYWQTFPCQQRVVRLGALDEDEKRDFFAAIDIFALPSRSDSFGLTLLEAWANGLPNIAYRAGGIADVIRHERDGLLVPCGAIDQLAAGLRRLCANAAERRRFGEVGRSRVRDEFKWRDKLQLARDTYIDCAMSFPQSPPSRG